MTNPFFCAILIPETKNNYFTERKTHHDQSVFCLWICVWSRLLQWRIRLCEACSYQDKQTVRFGLMCWILSNTILSELRKPLVLCEASGFFSPSGLTIQKEEVFELNIPTIDLAMTGTNIVNLRKAAGLSVHDLQMVFGFNSPQAIYKWQNGTALPTVDNLIVLAALLHVRIDDILVTTVA